MIPNISTEQELRVPITTQGMLYQFTCISSSIDYSLHCCFASSFNSFSLFDCLLLLLLLFFPLICCITLLITIDRENLRRNGLLNDESWGLIPLQLPNKINVSAQQSYNNSDNTEINRLTIERSYLLERIQNMSNTMERRIEGIYAYFNGNITKVSIFLF